MKGRPEEAATPLHEKVCTHTHPHSTICVHYIFLKGMQCRFAFDPTVSAENLNEDPDPQSQPC